MTDSAQSMAGERDVSLFAKVAIAHLKGRDGLWHGNGCEICNILYPIVTSISPALASPVVGGEKLTRRDVEQALGDIPALLDSIDVDAITAHLNRALSSQGGCEGQGDAPSTLIAKWRGDAAEWESQYGQSDKVVLVRRLADEMEATLAARATPGVAHRIEHRLDDDIPFTGKHGKPTRIKPGVAQETEAPYKCQRCKRPTNRLVLCDKCFAQVPEV